MFPRSLGEVVPQLSDFGKEALGFGAGILAAAFKLAQQVLLFLSQIHRCFDGGADIHVAVTASLQMGHALAAQPELFSCLGSRGHGYACAAPANGGHLDLAA